MRWYGPAALGLLVGGIALLAAAVASGGAEFHLVLIIPVVTGSSPLAFLSILIIMAAVILGFLAIAARQMERISDSYNEDPDISFSGPLPPALNPKIRRRRRTPRRRSWLSAWSAACR